MNETMTTQTVLIVDDEPDILQLLDITLSRMGLNTCSAADLETAQAALAEHSIDLCLTDMKLPDGNGISLVARAAGRPGRERRVAVDVLCFACSWHGLQRQGAPRLVSILRVLTFFQDGCC